MNVDKKAVRIQVSAEEARRTEENRVRLQHEREQLAIQRERQKLLLKEERQQTRENARRKRRIQRQQARVKLARRFDALMPTIGRRVLITVPIVAPMTVAWIGQISFAMDTLGWMFFGALIFAAAWELTTAFAGWMYHQARKDGDRGTLFRVATWVFAASAGAMNYWHACPVITERLNAQTVRHHIDLDPNPKAVSYGAMSLVGIALWELYSSLIHRKHLRDKGIVSSARPRFGILRWLRFSRITWTAWSLSVRYGIQTVDAAWSQAVAEVERRDHLKKLEREQKRLAKDKRPAVRVTVVRVADHTFAAPKTTLRMYRVDAIGSAFDRPEVPRDLSGGSERPALNGSQTGPGNGSGTGPTHGSETQTSGGSETGPGSRSETQVPNNDGSGSENGPETSRGNGSETGPKKRSRRRSKTGPKTKVPDRLAEARAADKAYLADHGRHIPAEKLARALGIGKPAALDLVKQVRGGHIDIAK